MEEYPVDFKAEVHLTINKWMELFPGHRHVWNLDLSFADLGLLRKPQNFEVFAIQTHVLLLIFAHTILGLLV